MSLADDESLLAMRAARMSVGTIAFTMGPKWSDRRVEARFQLLDERAAAEAEAQVDGAVPRPPIVPERQPHANPVRKPLPCPEPRKLAEGEGMVVRTFALATAGLGAAVLLADHRLVFTETGHVRPELNSQIKVTPGEGCFRMEHEP